MDHNEEKALQASLAMVEAERLDNPDWLFFRAEAYARRRLFYLAALELRAYLAFAEKHGFPPMDGTTDLLRHAMHESHYESKRAEGGCAFCREHSGP